MPLQVNVQPIRAAETRPLRHVVLRPHMPSETLVYPGDDDPQSLHAGAFVERALVGVASVSFEPHDEEPKAWRLRGMATLEHVRGMGVGSALIQACEAHVVARGGLMIWCQGRTSAWGFYQARGFEKRGPEFDPGYGTGPHYVMVKRIA